MPATKHDRSREGPRRPGSGTYRDDALRLSEARKYQIRGAMEHVPDAAGLYAIYGPDQAWTQLGLQHLGDDRPLYVGKAEGSLVTRDLKITSRPAEPGPRR